MDLIVDFCEGARMDSQTPPPPLHVSPKIEDGFFLGVVVLVSIAFLLVIQPFFAAILWGVIAAILFAPIYRNILEKMPTHRNGAALITLFLILGIVIIPAFVLGAALLQDAA
jgi:predicted PurR-regulated permease PerM